MIIDEIISEANVLVPNEVSLGDKVIWLNALNKDFFNVVKIPVVSEFYPTKDVTNYILSERVRLKNITLIMCGVVKYNELNENTPNPMQNTYTFDDFNHTLTLRPAPYQAGLQGIVRYYQVSSSTFTTTTLGFTPDAPEEYHWTFIPALASFIANTQDDAIKASNYENQYKSAWNVAAQNYAKEVTV